MPKQAPTVAALMLAAGYSRRFGSDKRKATLADGRSLLAASLALPCALMSEVWIVLRPEDDSHALHLPAGVQVVQDEATRQGMGHSLAAGAQRLLAHSRADAVAVFLADMPLISAASLRAVLERVGPARIVVPCHQGRRGHPVLFGRDFWPALTELAGDQGARTLFERFADAVETVALDDQGLLHDIDQPADYQALLRG